MSITTTRLRRSVGHRVAKDTLPELGFRDVFQNPHGRSLKDATGKTDVVLSCHDAGELDRGSLVGRDGSCQTGMKLSGSDHCFSSSWNLWLLSTMIWPSSASATLKRSSGRGAGPSKLMPVM